MSASVFVSYDAQVASLLGELRRFSSVFAPAPSPPARSVPVVWRELHQRWFSVANEIHKSGGHRGVGHDIRDWPAFLEEKIDDRLLEILLDRIFGAERRRVTNGNNDFAVRFKRTQSWLGMSADKMFLHLGLQVCGSITALKSISALSSSRPRKPVFAPAHVLVALRDRMLSRHESAELDTPPELSISDVTIVTRKIRGEDEPAAAAASGARLKRVRDVEDDDVEAEGGRRQASRRRTEDSFLVGLGLDSVAGPSGDLSGAAVPGQNDDDDDDNDNDNDEDEDKAAVWRSYTRAAEYILGLPTMDKGRIEGVLAAAMRAVAESALAGQDLTDRLAGLGEGVAGPKERDNSKGKGKEKGKGKA